VFCVSYGVFWAIKKTIGLRVSAEQEEAGLDIVEHGMFGYPELFIPPEEAEVPVTAGAPAGAPGLGRPPAPAASEA
jgi:Amt family ammonium transporter